MIETADPIIKVGITDLMEIRYVEETLRDDWKEVEAHARAHPDCHPEATIVFREAFQPLHRAELDVTRPDHQLDYIMDITGLSQKEAGDARYLKLFINKAENAWGLVVFRPDILVRGRVDVPEWWI